MNSETEIANAALLLIGAKEIIDLDSDTTTTGRIVQRWYAHTKDAFLRSYTWNFALARQSLSKDTTAVSTEFSNSYSLPTDPYCLRALSVFNSDSEWRIEKRKLLIDDGSVILKYISRVNNTVEFDDLFTDALIYKLGGNMAFPVMRDKVLQKELKIEAERLAQIARTADSMEGTFDKIESDVFIRARRIGSVIPPVTPPSSAGSPR